MIPVVVANNFYAPTPTLGGENYQIWDVKVNAYLKGLSLWEVVEHDVDPTALPSNQTLTLVKKYEESCTFFSTSILFLLLS